MKIKLLSILFTILPLFMISGCTDPVSSSALATTTSISACGVTSVAPAACASTAENFLESACDGSSYSTLISRCNAYVSCINAISGTYSGSIPSC